MKRGRRFRITTLKQPINFGNPFYSVGVTQPANRVYTAPLSQEGLYAFHEKPSSSSSSASRLSANPGMLKQMKELGIIPDDLGVDMKDFDIDTMALPTGVASVQRAEEEANIARQIQRYNAGILAPEYQEQKILLDIAKKRKQAEYRKKIIQWLAETDELDQVPAEFAEEVAEYYRAHPGAEATAQAARAARKAREEEKRRKKDLARGFWESNPVDNLLLPQQGPSKRYTPVAPPAAIRAPTLISDAEIEENLRQARFNALLAADADEQYNMYGDDYFGEGIIGERNRGWRAPRLHKLIRPFKKFKLEDTPDKIVDEQKQALDDRRTMYKEEQTAQRGVAPPKDMVERAMPKTAEPFFAATPMVLRFNKPDLGITLHPFIFPKKKYMVHTGLI